MNANSWTIALMLSCVIILSLGEAQAAPAIVTESGPLKGITSPSINKFLGVPYAAPPVGDLRWTPPQRHGRWQGVLDATELRSYCPQLDPFSGTGTVVGNENCLFLNVYTPGPKKENQDKDDCLPVMVWIHGGSLVQGEGGQLDPTPLVEKGGVIVVTINYRLGVLGFFAHPAFDAEGHLFANYGLLDQQFALRWVRRNIAAFGGDPKRVTIFGESAGGRSVYSNLASPSAAGLFQGAIAESGAYDAFQEYFSSNLPLATAEAQGTAFAASVGCGNQTAQCLRATSVSTLVNAQPGYQIPIVDGTVLTQTLESAFASGQFNRVPVISGGNHDEDRLDVALAFGYQGQGLMDADYPAVTADYLGPAWLGLPVTDSFVKHIVNVAYPLSNYPVPPSVQSAPLALGASLTDAEFACPERNSVRLLAQYVPTYAYEFNDENPPLYPLPPANFPLGAYHSAEVQYLFNLLGPDLVHYIAAPFTADQQQLSDAMIGYWAQFAASGDPNLRSAPRWARYSARTDKFQSLLPPTPTAESNFDAAHQCTSLWNIAF
jgi:para-nitrobenzyl esterase